jgi:TonB dependent receptor/Carboxypeptidase regulatory-like domain
MTIGSGRANVLGLLTQGLAIAFVLIPWITVAQGLTGALVGTVTDAGGGVISGAVVRLSSPALIGGDLTTKTDERGRLRFPSVPPGSYALEIVLEGFRRYRDADIRIGAGATIERTPVLTLAALADSIVVHGSGSRLDARDPGFGTRFGAEDLDAIPMRRFSYQDWVKTAPGISPTSPAGSSVLVSALGSGVDQNQYLLDGTSITATGNGVSRAEPGNAFIQELQIQSVGASVEYGNVQGAVVNVISKSGGNRFQHDAAYYWQTGALTSQPVRRPFDAARQLDSGYERADYRDFTTSVGGPVIRDRLWFFSGYQHLRDSDSQPATNPDFPREYEQDKVFAKISWRLAPGWQLTQSFHDEFWSNPETPSATKPRDATQRLDASVPAINFGHLVHTASPNTVWDVRVGRFRFTQDTSPTSGDPTIPHRVDQPENIWSGGPQQIGQVRQVRTTVKATVTHYRAAWFGGDHEWRMGAQVDRGEHRAVAVLPTGASSVYRNGVLRQRTLQEPANSGGRFVTAAVFASDAVRLGGRVTINPGLRFDHSRAISQDVPEFDAFVHETGRTIEGRGTVGSWNTVSPRVGVVVKLDTDGRTMLRANAGRFSQGLLTGEISGIHPGRTRVTIVQEPLGTTLVRDPSQVQLDPELRLPYTNQYSIGLDREVGGLIASVAYVRKDGRDFIGWEELAGEYREEPAILNDGRVVQVWRLTTPSESRLFQLTNPDDYSLTYNGLVIAAERRRSRGWQAAGSYTLSRADGLQPSSGTTAAGPQVATVGSPPASFAPGVTFGQDPNDLTNAYGRLPNDRPHMIRVMTSVDVPRTGFVLAANLQHLSGKPWAMTALVNPNEAARQVLIEPRGTRRLSSQTLLDVRVSRALRFSDLWRVELCLDVLNLLNDTAEESIMSASYDAANLGQPDIFIDPRRAMLSLRLNLGR